MQFMEKVVSEYLGYINVHCSKMLVESKIRSHVDYPSLISVTDTFEDLGLQFEAMVAEDKSVESISFPILIHCRVYSGERLVTVYQKGQLSDRIMWDNWTGVFIHVLPNQRIDSSLNNRLYKQELNSRYMDILLIVSILSSLIFALLYKFNFFFLLLSLVYLIGYGCAHFISSIYHSNLNVSDSKICKSGVLFDCNKVLYSKYSNLFLGLRISDIAQVSFLGFYLVLIFLQIFSVNKIDIGLIFSFSVVASLISIYYIFIQVLVVKKYCKLCLAVGFLFIISLLIIFLGAQYKKFEFSYGKSTLYILIFATIISLSFVHFYNLIINYKSDQLKMYIELFKTKYNPSAFEFIHSRQKNIINSAINSTIIVFGSSAPKVLLTIVTNPFCKPCGLVHQRIANLPSSILNITSVEIVFSVVDIEELGLYNKAIIVLILALKKSNRQDRLKILSEWYEKPELSLFMNRYKIDEQTIASNKSTLASQLLWCQENSIIKTPTIYINGRELSSDYELEDLYRIYV